jgi:hypothetical protein
VQGLTNTSSDLEIDTEHGVNILISNTSGKTANLHLDFYQRPPIRITEFVGPNGRISFDYYASRFEVFAPDRSEPVEVTDISDPFDRNNMFVSELKHFFDCIANNDTPVTSLAEGKPARNVALRAIAN